MTREEIHKHAILFLREYVSEITRAATDDDVETLWIHLWQLGEKAKQIIKDDEQEGGKT